MNPTVDNDLQKAIDDITKNTNVDPVFSDPVAAPSSIPEGDSGIIGEPVGPFSDIKPPVMSAPISMPPLPKRPVAPTAVSVEAVAVAEPIAPAPAAPIAEAPAMSAPEAPAVMPTPKTMPAPETQGAPVVEAPVMPEEPIAAPEPMAEGTMTTESKDMRSVKEAALRDLAPLLNKIDMDSSKKFKLYKDIREELHDDSIIGDAYTAAKDIADERERGEALLYLVESIDNM